MAHRDSPRSPSSRSKSPGRDLWGDRPEDEGDDLVVDPDVSTWEPADPEPDDGAELEESASRRSAEPEDVTERRDQGRGRGQGRGRAKAGRQHSRREHHGARMPASDLDPYVESDLGPYPSSVLERLDHDPRARREVVEVMRAIVEESGPISMERLGRRLVKASAAAAGRPPAAQLRAVLPAAYGGTERTVSAGRRRATHATGPASGSATTSRPAR